MSLIPLLLLILLLLIILLLIIWWVRWTARGVLWAFVSLFIAIGLSLLSSLIFRVPPYQMGCQETCAGWWGYPYPTHRMLPGSVVIFDGASFVINTFFYYAVFLAYSAILAWMIRRFRMTERSLSRWLLFTLFFVILPLATLPLWVPPPQPTGDLAQMRLVNNAARNWRWRLHLRGWMDRRLALEDVRPAPDGKGPRVCFRIYTWFYLPYKHAYIDLDEAGLYARGGDEIPLSQSCFEIK